MNELNWQRVLVFGAHSDDEIIGPGGTIARLAAQGAQVAVVTFTRGETGYARDELKGRMAELRAQESAACDRMLGITERINLGKPTQGIPDDRETYQECVRLIRRYRPEVIFTHYYEDKHRDHRVVSALTDEARWKASENVLSDLGPPWYTPALYYYEITELFTHPSLVVDITDTFERKLEAMRTQVSQLDVVPGILRYLEGIGRARGYLCETSYAEAFLASNLLPTRF
ncbi:MAG: PIG-L deacetylase family protein [Anaerolineae bacterium]